MRLSARPAPLPSRSAPDPKPRCNKVGFLRLTWGRVHAETKQRSYPPFFFWRKMLLSSALVADLNRCLFEKSSDKKRQLRLCRNDNLGNPADKDANHPALSMT